MQASTRALQRPDVLPESGSAIQAKDHAPLGELGNLKEFGSRENAPTRVTTRPAEDESSGKPDKQQRKAPLTIKQLREAAQETAQNNANKNATRKKKDELANVAVPAPQKKKPSLFGGLFQVREPTQAALNQVAAQMIAQHGSISPTKVPNVRLEKMPEHVPKVNSKWDGVPDVVKQREKREKEAAKARKKDLFSANASRSGSSATGDDSRRRLNSRNSSSTTGSFNSRGRSVGSNSNSGRARFYAQSVNSSGDLASQHRGDRPKPHSAHGHSHSASASSLPESVADTIPEVPQYLREAIVASGSMTESSVPKGLDENTRRPLVTIKPPSDPLTMRKVEQAPSIEDVPIYSTSPLPSPQDIIPATPSDIHPSNECIFKTRHLTAEQSSSLSTAPGIPAATAIPKKRPQPIMPPGFLAGEAQELVLPNDRGGPISTDLPLRSWESGRMTATTSSLSHARVQQDLEKRPDSSRARLGLRASILLRDDENPWELLEQQAPSLPSPRTPTSPRLVPSPRTKFSKGFGLFSKEKDKP